jgi:sec-independent protein translocase protein TatA
MFTQFAFLDLGAPELIIILAILLLLFGGKKLPELSRSLGESMRELRKGLSDEVTHDKKETKKTDAADEDASE